MKHPVTTCLFLFGFAFSCTNSDIDKKIDCNLSDLGIALVSKTDALGCNAIDGKLIVAGANGKPPYLYKINGGTFQANPEFANLGSGTYSVTVKDANECSKSIDVAIDAANSTLNASIVAIGSSLCSSPNGSATINGTGGTPPYSYLFSTGGFVTSREL